MSVTVPWWQWSTWFWSSFSLQLSWTWWAAGWRGSLDAQAGSYKFPRHFFLGAWIDELKIKNDESYHHSHPDLRCITVLGLSLPFPDLLDHHDFLQNSGQRHSGAFDSMGWFYTEGERFSFIGTFSKNHFWNFDGPRRISAKVFQHEYDHMLGKLYIEYASDYMLRNARKKQKGWQRKKTDKY